MGEDALQGKAKQKAFRLLAVRGRSEKELRSKLREKGFDEAVIEEVVARFYELKYLDDASFARQWARNLGVNKLFGNRRIVSSLREKGISPPLIEEAIAALRSEISETEAIKILLGKKMASCHVVNMDDKIKGRLFRSLMGKGFPTDLIFHMLNELSGESLGGMCE
jgi:regulatory protein